VRATSCPASQVSKFQKHSKEGDRVVSVPTQEEFDALLKKVQVLELKIPELEKQVAESKAAVQLMRDMIDTAHAAIHPV